MADHPTQRRLAAILAADVAGYTRLMEEDTDTTVAAWQAARDGVIDPVVLAHSGRLVKFTGDGFLVEFSTVQDAVKCAVAMQEHLTESHLKFRMGINLGDIVDDGRDIHGEGVNVAARLEALAEPGGICVSAEAYTMVRNRVDCRFEDLGEHDVKHVTHPVRVYAIRLSGATTPAADPVPKMTAQAASPAIAASELDTGPAIAVLAFDNMSGDADQEYFSDGVAEDVITDLSKLSSLAVIARNSSFAYKGRSVDLKTVARELGVKYVLEGSVRRAGNRVRVTAQLIDGSSGRHLWAERYDRDLTDIFEVQDDVTRQIVTALKVKLSAAEEIRIAEGGTQNVDAHDLFLRGRELAHAPKKDREMFDQATTYFQRAIDLDPDYAEPYAGMALVHVLDHHNGWSGTPEASLDKADRFVREAVARDDKDPFAHYIDALAGMFRKDYARWTQAADRALALNPNYALALNARGIVEIYSGAPADGIPYVERAMRLDPGTQQLYLHFLGIAHFIAGDYEKAAEAFRGRISIYPTTDLSRAFLASTLGHLDNPDEARSVWRELMDINPEYDPEKHIGRLPFKHPKDAEEFMRGLSKAGLPG